MMKSPEGMSCFYPIGISRLDKRTNLCELCVSVVDVLFFSLSTFRMPRRSGRSHWGVFVIMSSVIVHNFECSEDSVRDIQDPFRVRFQATPLRGRS